jgi:antibiotic biosynthesis monooxygenase (ABM) superfamily enzyme
MSVSTAPPVSPSTHRRALLTWLAVYPTITAAAAALDPLTAQLPLVVRTLILTAVVVPAVVYALIPALLSVDAILAGRVRQRYPEGASRRQLGAPR